MMVYPQQNMARHRIDLGDCEVRADSAATDGNRQFAAPRSMAIPGCRGEPCEDWLSDLGWHWYAVERHVPSGWRAMVRAGSACPHVRAPIDGVAVGAPDGGHLPFGHDIGDQVRWDAPNRITIAAENELRPRVSAGNTSSLIGAFASIPRTTPGAFPCAWLDCPLMLSSVPPGGIDDITVTTDIIAGTVQLHGAGCAAEAPSAFPDGVPRTSMCVLQACLWPDRDPPVSWLALQAGGGQDALPSGTRTMSIDGEYILLNGFGCREVVSASGTSPKLSWVLKDCRVMQCADREGFPIIDELLTVSPQFENDERCAERLAMCTRQLDAFARNKRHPSVVMWCVANEPMLANLRLAGGVGGDQPGPTVERGRQFLDTNLYRAVSGLVCARRGGRHARMRTRSGVSDIAATQSSMRVGGLNMKGIFTRTRAPTTMAHVSREFWSRG